MQEQTGNLAHLATITSRPEALVVASALEHAGIRTWIDGVHYASVDPISVALGGHRLRVFADQWQEASDILREMDLPGGELAYKGQQLSVIKVLLVYIGYWYFWLVPGVIMGALLAGLLALAPLNAFTAVPVDPRGRNDFHLAPKAVT